MRYFKLLVINSIVLAMSQVMAEDYTYLFNPATMEVGQSVGEYLEVKESCPDGGTSCTASSKLKYVTAIEGRTGRLEIPVSASNNFEISFNVRGKDCSVSHTYTLYMSDGNSLSLNVGGCYTGVRGTGIIGGGNINWLDGINDFRIIVKDGKLEISTNDDIDGETELSGTLNRIVISKINTGEEDIFEIRTRGIQGGSCPVVGGDYEAGRQACISNPASCDITVSGNDTTISGDCMANYFPAGQLHVPCVSVPDAFGGTTVYDIKLNQQTGSFTFDLDMGSVKPK